MCVPLQCAEGISGCSGLKTCGDMGLGAMGGTIYMWLVAPEKCNATNEYIFVI